MRIVGAWDDDEDFDDQDLGPLALAAAPVSVAVEKGRRRLRAPSGSWDTCSSEEDEKDEADTLSQVATLVPARVIPRVSRQELLRNVEQACEVKAVVAMTSSSAYQSLCETLQRARLNADRDLQAIDRVQEDPAFVAIIRSNTEMERKRTQQISQLRTKERSALQKIERDLKKYQEERAAESRAQQEARERAEAAERRAEQERKEQQARLEAQEAAKLADEEAKKAAEKKIQEELAKTEREQAEKKEADEAQKKADAAHQQQQLQAKQEAARATKEYIREAEERVKRLQVLQEASEQILANQNPAIKKLRVEIKVQAGACNQISAAPSAIKMVVTKIHTLLQNTKGHSEQAFQYALNLVGQLLTKQTRVVLDYKACYPVAHVIVMSCVLTPELTDILLGYMHQMCVFTIPDNPGKKNDQTVAEYKRTVGFEPAVGDTSDPDGLEHVTVYAKRMTMIVSVLAAVMQTTPYDDSPQPKGLSIGDCWTWLARLVNDPPHLMTGPLLLTILEVAGFELHRHYRKQFHKLLVLIARDVCPKLSKDAKTGAANAAGQLEMWIAQYQNNGCTLTEPEGRKLEETKISDADENRTEDGGNGGYGGGGRGYGNGNGGGRGGGRGRGRGRGR